MSALSIATRGMICLGGSAQSVVVSDKPHITAEEIKPSVLSAASESPAAAPVTAPTIVSSSDVKPQIRSSTGDATGGAVSAPKVVSSSSLKPQIREATSE